MVAMDEEKTGQGSDHVLTRLLEEVERLLDATSVPDPHASPEAFARLEDVAGRLDRTEAALAEDVAVLDRSLDRLTEREEDREPELRGFLSRFLPRRPAQPEDAGARPARLAQAIALRDDLLRTLSVHRAACLGWAREAEEAMAARTRAHSEHAEALDRLHARAATLLTRRAEHTDRTEAEARMTAELERLEADLAAAEGEFRRLDTAAVAGEAAVARLYRHVGLLDLAIAKLKVDVEKAVLHHHAFAQGSPPDIALSADGHAWASLKAMEEGRLAARDIARRKSAADAALMQRLHPPAGEGAEPPAEETDGEDGAVADVTPGDGRAS